MNQGLLAALSPRSIADYSQENERNRLAREFDALRVENQRATRDLAQQEAAGARRAMAVSLLGGIANEQDPAKQAELYATIRPMVERYDSTLKLPDAYDPSLAKALMWGQMGPKDQLAALTKETGPIKLGPGDVLFDPVSQQPIFSAPTTRDLAPPPAPKPLTMPAMKDLEGKANAYDQMSRLSAGFRPEYAGNTVTGGVENFIGRMGGENVGLTDPGQSQWWQDYQSYVNQVRNDLFGSALTATEKAEFLKAMATPNMDPEQVAANLARQRALAQKALSRSGSVYQKGGFNPDQIGEYVPQGLEGVDTSSPALDGPRGNRPLVTTQEEFDALPSGAIYMEDDGQVYVKP